MARLRKDKLPKIPLAQPDKSGPSRATLLDIAEQRGLLKTYDGKADTAALGSRIRPGKDEEPLVGRIGESMLWSISLTMLHFTMDVLVSHQYAVEIVWKDLVWRSLQAFPIIFLLFYSFHPHPTPSMLLPPLSPRLAHIAHQALFFTGSVCAGCYLIYITNAHGYYAVMKQSPPLGCIWIWAVIELNLLPAVGSLACCGAFLKWGGYKYL